MRAVFFLAALCCSLVAYPQNTRVEKIRLLEPQVTEFFRRAQYKKSLEMADSILKLAPASMVYLTFCYETSLVDLRDTVRAVGYLKKIVTSHPFEADYLDQYGWVMLKEKNLPAAVEFSGRAFQLEQESLTVMINHAHSLHAKGETAKALEIYRLATEFTFSQAVYARNQRQDFILLDSLYPGTGFSMLAAVLEKNFDELLQAYQMPNSMAVLIDSLERYNVAEAEMAGHWQRALVAESVVDPLRRKNMSLYHGALGAYHDRRGNIETAKAHYYSALEHDLALHNQPGMARRYQMLGSLHVKRGDVDSAIYFYRMACSMYEKMSNPLDLARTNMLLAKLHHEQGMNEEAWLLVRDSVVPAFEKYNAHYDLIPAYEFLAEQYARKGLPETKKIYLEKAIEVVGLNSLPGRMLNNIYLLLGSVESN